MRLKYAIWITDIAFRSTRGPREFIQICSGHSTTNFEYADNVILFDWSTTAARTEFRVNAKNIFVLYS